ncbi:hypothetical protein DSC_02175 [Pseudoxanthomonas spadix BD-a59]|uniref:Secreted protein n=2 Tax=Pseudoxanthomonas spadix TaxID=415229 RepID=G7UV09_PSEUP|nr:hypothetical protein DSC_02175 [Pseudoxanthomonas spadix BD-a59]
MCVMRLLSSALFFSLGLAIGTAASGPGGPVSPAAEPAGDRISASDPRRAPVEAIDPAPGAAQQACADLPSACSPDRQPPVRG